MGQATNTCIIYDKIQHSSDVLTNVSYSRINLNTKLSFLRDSLEQLSSVHDNVLNASLSCLDEVIQNINDEFDVVEKMSFDLLGVTLAFNEAEGKFDNDKLSKAIQKSNFVGDDIKGNIEDNGISTYSSKESFEKNLTDEELKVLEQYKKKMEELTSSKVVSNFKTVNDFLTLGTTSSFATAFTASSLLIPSKTPLEFLDGVTGPYSKEGLKGLLMEKYPGLTEEMANKYVAQHMGEEISDVKEKTTKKEPVSEDGSVVQNNDDTPSDNSDEPNINYRKTTSDSDDYSSSDGTYSSYNDNYSNGDSSLNSDLYDDNSGNESYDNSNILDEPSDNKDGTDLSSDEDVKVDSEDKIQDDSIGEKTGDDGSSSKTEVPQESQIPDEKSDSNSSDDIPIKNKTPQPSIFSQIGTDLTTSIIDGNDDVSGSLDLQADELSNISTIPSGSKNSAIDDMLTYSPMTPKEAASTNSSSIAPVAIGLGLAGTTSVAANKIIKKKEKKQEDIINSFIDKEANKEERRFIPLDAIGDDDLDNSFELEKTSKEDDITPSPEKGKTSEEWYDYIKELY